MNRCGKEIQNKAKDFIKSGNNYNNNNNNIIIIIIIIIIIYNLLS